MSIRRCVYLHCVCLGMFICFDFTKYGSSSGVLNIFCLHKFTVCSTPFLELGHVTFLATYANAVIRDSSSPNFHPRVSSRKSTGRSGHPLLAKPSCACHPTQMLLARLNGARSLQANDVHALPTYRRWGTENASQHSVARCFL